MLSDTVQCKQLMRDRFLDNMTFQNDVGQGSPDASSLKIVGTKKRAPPRF